MSPLELFAASLGAIAVYLTVRQNPWCWPIGLVMVALAVGFVLVLLLLWYEKRKLTRRTRRCQQSALDSAERGHNGTPDILHIHAQTSTPRPSNIPAAARSGAGDGHCEVLQPLLVVTPQTSADSTCHAQASNAERDESESTERENVDQEATGCSIATGKGNSGRHVVS